MMECYFKSLRKTYFMELVSLQIAPYYPSQNLLIAQLRSACYPSPWHDYRPRNAESSKIEFLPHYLTSFQTRSKSNQPFYQTVTIINNSKHLIHRFRFNKANHHHHHNITTPSSFPKINLATLITPTVAY